MLPYQLTYYYPHFLAAVFLVFLWWTPLPAKGTFFLRGLTALLIAVALAHVNRLFDFWPAHRFFASGHMTFAFGTALLLGALRPWTLALTLPSLVPFGMALVALRFHSVGDVLGAFPIVLVVYFLVGRFWGLMPATPPLDRAPFLPRLRAEMLFGLTPHRDPRLQLLKNVVLFKDLSLRDLAMVNSLMHERHYLAEEVIFDEGEEGQGLFVVLSGRVKITLPANMDRVLIELGPGAFFGEVALLDQSIRTAQARAIDDTEIVALFRTEFYSLLETHSTIASRVSFQLAKVLAARLRQAVLNTARQNETG